MTLQKLSTWQDIWKLKTQDGRIRTCVSELETAEDREDEGVLNQFLTQFLEKINVFSIPSQFAAQITWLY